MAEGIPGPPNEYPAGLAFDYSVWTAGTQVDLVNVNWNNDYRDVVKFGSKALLNTYIDSLAPAGIRITKMTYAKPGQDIMLGIPYNRVNRYNYLRASNPLMPIEGDIQKDFYYFILECEYINPTTTRIRVQLDVWQTYIYDVTFGRCYVERGHIGIANSNQFNNYGRDYLTIPEGDDLGSDYMTVATRNKWILSLTAVPLGDGSRYPGHDVLVIATTDLGTDGGTSDNPNLNSADGTTFQGTTQGAGIWIFSPQQFDAFLAAMADKPWITQGIISVTIIPRFTRYHPSFTYGELVSLGKKAETLYPVTLTYDMFTNWRNSSDYTDYIPARYRNLMKLRTFPYTAVEMTTFGATPVVIKPEAWNNANGRVFERAALLPPGQRVEVGPRFYNSRNTDEAQLPDLYPAPITGYAGVKGDDNGDYVDIVTQVANFPTMTIVNNGQLGYLAANVHGIAHQYQSASWSQQRALAGASAQYDVGSGAIAANKNLTDIANMVDTGQTANQNALIGETAVASGIAGIAGGAGGGAVFGARGAGAGGVSSGASAIAGGITAGMQMSANDRAVALRNSERSANVGIQNRQAMLSRDTNVDLARFAARGDYANEIDGIDAKVQDAALIQPTTSGQMGGEAMNLINGGWQVSLRVKMIDPARIAQVGERWLRYGYAIHRFMSIPESLMVMSKFTYWKMKETYIVASNVPEGHKQVLRGITEKGVTVWADPAYIGVTDTADNAPLGGVSY